MFNLSAVPEIGLGSKTICDVCMRRSSSEYYNCGYHKMCDLCRQRFASQGVCPLCGKCNQRCIEKSVGRCQFTPSTYVPESMPAILEAPCPLDEDIFTSSSSESSLLTSLSSNDMMFSDSDEDEQNNALRCIGQESCGDPFACLDAAYEASHPECDSNSGLLRCGFSVYSPNTQCDTFCTGDLPTKDSVMSDYSEDVGTKRRTLQKTKRISSDDLQRIIDLCKDITV